MVTFLCNMFFLLLADAFCVYPNNEYLVYQWIPSLVIQTFYYVVHDPHIPK